MESARAIYFSFLLLGFTILAYCWLYNKSAPPPYQDRLPCESIQQRGESSLCPREGLYQLHYKSFEETEVDIIAIHGLDTKSPDTWTWKSNKRKAADRNEEETETDLNWLANASMLPKVAGKARIYTLNWPSKLLDHSPTPTTLEESAEFLLNEVTRHIGANTSRPIIFIASCLGGIILLKALDLDGGNGMKSPPSIRQTTRGIVFLATPFRGTAFEMVPSFLLKVLVSLQGRTITALIDYSLKPISELDALVKSFIILTRDRDYLVAMFWEADNTVLLRKFYLQWIASHWMFRAWMLAFLLTILLDSFSPWMCVSFVVWLFVVYIPFRPKQVYKQAKPTINGKTADSQ